MPRRAALLLVLITACTGPAVTKAPAPFGATTSTTSATTSPTTTTEPGQPLSPPELPDPFDLAEEPLADLDVDGFEFADVDPELVETVSLRLSIFGSLYTASVWDELVSDDDDEVVAFSLYPAGEARGDPTLAMVAAEAIAEGGDAFGEATERRVAGQMAYEIVDSTTTWLLWANNTHLFVTAGPDGAAADVMEAIIDQTIGSEYQWATGDCLYFDDGAPYAPFGTGNVVSCGGPHEWEVTRSEPLDEGGDFDGETLSDLVGANCEEAFFNLTGVVPIDSPLNQVFYLPDEAEWDEGDRYFACIVSRNDAGGGTKLITGSLDGAADTVSRTVGDCYRRIIDVGLVQCNDPHVYEYIGMADYPGGTDDEFPGGTELADLLTQACDDLIDDYMSDRSVEGATITPFNAELTSFTWDRGLRSVPCFAFALDEGTPSEVVGSFSGGWGPLGDADGAIQV